MRRGQLESHLLVLVTLALVAFGLVMVYSATSASAALGGGNSVGYLERQGVYALVGIALMIVAARTDFRSQSATGYSHFGTTRRQSDRSKSAGRFTA